MSYHGGNRSSQYFALPSNIASSVQAFLTNPSSPIRIRHLFGIGPLLIVLWVWTLYRGERSLFNRSVNGCDWNTWEQWPADANPHRLVFVADPQLVDPHTYPGRPWPLSTFTCLHTDNYIRRAWTRINHVLYPDTVFFLGDLFDGGREWSTLTEESEDKQWNIYKEKFWLKEYDRFGKIFFDVWTKSGLYPRSGHARRRLIPSLPGNHDLGFGTGIHTSVRGRFNAYFGEGSRIDVVANHTFVSLDSVSLSAKGSTSSADEQIWKPVEEFLDNAQASKNRAVIHELRKQQGLSGVLPYKHEVVDTGKLPQSLLPDYEQRVDGLPTILLTHVPLYRNQGEPCGPMREHWPPTPPPKGQTDPVYPDHRNAISISGGYQYQNVMTENLSKEVTEKIGNISYAFSGDDHDYCEVVHRRYPSAGSGIREITVKSISWAMGVRHPGFVMLSLWNPIDSEGRTLGDSTKRRTLQTHLCLLPDQLGIFISYVQLVGLTFLCLIIRALLVSSGRISGVVNKDSTTPILPITNHPTSSAEAEKAELGHSRNTSYADDDSSNGSVSSDSRGTLNARHAFARTKSENPPTGYGLPMAKSTYAYPAVDGHKALTGANLRSKSKKKGFALFWAEFSWSFVKVAGTAFAWYFWLIWNG